MNRVAINKFIPIMLIIIVFAGVSYSQECGPSCPVCSGGGGNASALLPQRSLMISGLSIPTADEETGVLNIRYGILDRIDAGVGYAVQTEKVLWSVRIQPVLEQAGGWRPGIILGTGSVQTGGSDQSVYAQFLKSFEINEIIGLRLSAGAASLVPDFDEAYGLTGITVNLDERYAVFANYDGKSFHEGVSWTPLDWLTLSFLMVESDLPAFSIIIKR